MVRSLDHGKAALLALLFALLSATPAAAAPVRVVEAEGMKVVSGAVVRAPDAVGGRAVALRSSGSATANFTTEAVGSVVLRARAVACGRAKSLTVVIDGGLAHALTPKTRWREQRVNLALPAGAHTVKVIFTGAKRKRCRALLDRVRLPAPALRREALGPVAPPTAQVGRYVPLGASVQQKHFTTDPVFEQTFRREFVSLTPENEMKMEWVQPEKGEWNFQAADDLVAYAQANGKAVRGHALVFGTQTPPWVKRLLLPDDAKAALREHILTVMGRYKTSVHEWDVVNEALDKDGRYRSNPWTEKLGTIYVELAYRYAREANPEAKLIYNEYDADTKGVKRDATANLVLGLKKKGLIDGVGLQMHRNLADAPSRAELEETMRLYESMGLEVQITEMDVLAGGATSLTDRLDIQAGAYRNAAEACAAVKACTRMTVWGVGDKYSWMGVDQLPLLLDAAGQPKPALAAVREVIGG
jgi:endo-1,4-beta-xylanase